jgi:hypothetical protein
MLDDVRKAAKMFRLRPRSDHCVEADRNRFCAGQRVDGDGEAVAEDVHFRAHF